jgi:hypothetical protein
MNDGSVFEEEKEVELQQKSIKFELTPDEVENLFENKFVVQSKCGQRLDLDQLDSEQIEYIRKKMEWNRKRRDDNDAGYMD